MSILSTLLPFALSVSAQALAASAPVMDTPLPELAPVVAQPVIPAPAPVVPVVVTAPKPVAPKPVPAITQPGGAEVVKVQGPTATLDRNGIIDRVAKAMSDTRTAQGRFTQIDPQGAPSSGAFYISRPGKVRFEYTTPEPMFIVSDGSTVSIEEPRRKAYDAIPLASTPLNLFLRSNIDLKRDGSVTDVSSSNGFHYVTLVDKSGEAEGRMILQFRQSDFELMGWRQVDATGAETRVQLADIKQNVSLRPSLFVVRDPNDNDDRR